MEVQTFVMDSLTGLPVKIGSKKKNLVLDAGLIALAHGTGSTGLGDSFNVLRLGSGTNPNSYASGAVTFTQSGNTLIASAPFFASNMVGGIFKFGASGSSGAESYITAFTSSSIVTVSTSVILATPTAGTVWMVQQTTLQTPLYTTGQYRTLGGDCGTTYTAGTMVLKRTFINPSQATSYTVAEIGWYSTGAGSSINGRFALPAPDVVGTSNFYLVVMTLTINFTPATPLAVANVGTGLNTAGNLMLEWFNFTHVDTTGATANASGSELDQERLCSTAFITGATYSQQSSLLSSTPYPLVVTGAVGASGLSSWVYSGTPGLCTLTQTSTSTTTGQTCYGVAITDQSTPTDISLDVKFTTPVTLPNGTFNPTTVWQLQYGRTLTN